MIDRLVRGGSDARLPYDRKARRVTHTATAVYGEMLLQVCRDYSGLPDPRSLTVEELVFFYSGLRAELKQATAPKKRSR